MKKAAAFILAVLILATCGAADAKYNDIDASSPSGTAVEQLSRLNILSGFGDDSFRPNDTLTREQFAKIAVCMLGEEKSAASMSADNVFSDVTPADWSSGYINYIAQRGIINGYPDGSFGKDDTINYAQALTILVRLLGYSGEDVSYRWPDGYIKKAQALGICDGMSFGTYENVTRANAAYIVYNTLLADKKEGSDISLMSAQSTEDVIIYADSSLDASVDAGNIVTTKGTFKLAQTTTITSDDYGKIGTLYTDSEKKAVAFVPEKESVKSVTVSSGVAVGDTNKVELTYTYGTQTCTESFAASALVFEGGRQLTMETAVSSLEAGREARLVYGEDGSFTRMLLMESKLEGPKTVVSGGGDIYSLFQISENAAVNVVRDGVSAALSDIKPYDVVYYMRSISTVYAYTDKIYGTYEKAYPMKSNVTSVKVAGSTYTLSTQAAINKLNESSGAASLGSKITLLLGKDGTVADVVTGSASSLGNIGVLTNSYIEVSDEEQTKGQSTRYVSLTLPDGSETIYKADKDYTDYIGSVMKITLNGDVASLGYLSASTVYGKLDKSARTLDSSYISEDCEILELTNKKDGGAATVKKIELYDIELTSLSRNQVLYAQKTASTGDIEFLYLTDVTKSGASFGVVKKAEGSNRYTILYDGAETSVKTSLALSVGTGVEVKGDGSIEMLTKLASGSIEGIESGRIRVNSKTYSISDYVKIYGGSSGSQYTSMSLSELKERTDILSVTLYSDKSAQSGGTVRVITVLTK